MELWIRSQDKRRLMKASNIYLDEEIEYDNRKYAIKCGTIDIGYYTFYGAIKVLDEIQNILKPQMILSKVGKPIAETCDGLVYREPDEYEIKEISIYVYEMPKE